jgi:hypothetical protein
MIVDAVTASMLVTIYDALKEEKSREKFDTMDLKVLVGWGWKQVKTKGE